MEDATLAAPGLEQRVVRAPRTELAPTGSSEVIFVCSGRGVLSVDGEEHALEPETGAFVGSGEQAVIEADPGALEMVVVRAPDADLRSGRVVCYRDGEAEDAG